MDRKLFAIVFMVIIIQIIISVVHVDINTSVLLLLPPPQTDHNFIHCVRSEVGSIRFFQGMRYNCRLRIVI